MRVDWIVATIASGRFHQSWNPSYYSITSPTGRGGEAIIHMVDTLRLDSLPESLVILQNFYWVWMKGSQLGYGQYQEHKSEWVLQMFPFGNQPT